MTELVKDMLVLNSKVTVSGRTEFEKNGFVETLTRLYFVLVSGEEVDSLNDRNVQNPKKYEEKSHVVLCNH